MSRPNHNRYVELMRRATTRMREQHDEVAPATGTDDDDFVTSFSNFRASRDTRPGHRSAAAAPYRRRTNPLYSFKVICLDSPQHIRVNSLLIRRLNAKGLGSKKVIIGRRAPVEEFKNKVRDYFPLLKNANVEFDFCVATKVNGNRLTPVRANTIRELKSLVPHSIYVRPKRELGLSGSNISDVVSGGVAGDNNNDDDDDEDDDDLYDPQLNAPLSVESEQSNTNQEPVQSRRRTPVVQSSSTDNSNTGQRVRSPRRILVHEGRATSSQQERSTNTENRISNSIVPATPTITVTTSSQSTSTSTSTPQSIQSVSVPADTPEVERNERRRRRRAIEASNFIHAVTTTENDLRRNSSNALGQGTRLSLRGGQRGRGRGRNIRRGANERRQMLALSGRRTESVTVVSSDEEAEIAPSTPAPQTSQITNVAPGEEVVAGYVTAGTPTVLISTSTTRRELIDVTSEIGLNGTDMNNFIPDNVANFGDSGPNSSIGSLKQKLIEHRQNFINTASEEEDQLLLEVRRQFVLTDSLSLIRHSGDNIHRPLHIKFTEECGIDLGGLRREFWSLFCHQLTHSTFVTGKPNRLTFQANFMEKKKNNFFYIGQLVALSIIQDGAGLPIFADIVTDYILNGELSPILNEDDLLDHIKDVTEKMQNSSNDNLLKEEYAKIIDTAFEAGFVVPSSAFKRTHINPLKAALVEHLVTGCKDELDQFIQGLKTHQVLDLLRLPENRTEARCLFSGRLPPITTNKLRELMKFNYSEGNRKLQELATAQGFLTFLMSTQGNTNVTDEVKIQTKDVVMWLTGSNIIPAVGFHKLIDVEFGDRTFVNTCALTLTLKLQPNLALDDAVDYYTDLIINGQTFSME